MAQLFREGNSYVAYPLRVVWLPLDEQAQVAVGIGDEWAQLAVSVPKRVFKTAVVRNRIKRRIREAYRLSKTLLRQKLAHTDQHIALILVYIAKEELPYVEIESGIKKVAKKFPVPENKGQN